MKEGMFWLVLTLVAGLAFVFVACGDEEEDTPADPFADYNCTEYDAAADITALDDVCEWYVCALKVGYDALVDACEQNDGDCGPIMKCYGDYLTCYIEGCDADSTDPLQILDQDLVLGCANDLASCMQG